MVRALFRKTGFLFALSAALGLTALSAPLAAQGYSAGFEFLKSVRDRDGAKVTEALDEPGSTLIGTRDLATGQTALHIVVERRDAPWVKFLLQRGANPNAADKKGLTPLVIASNLGFIEAIQALVDAGARIDEPNAAGETALMSAVHRRDIALVRLLLGHGANPDRTDNSGRSARDYAELMKSSSLLDEFQRAESARKTAGATYGPGL